MKYLVSPEVFALDSRLRFGIIIGKDIKNRLSTSGDELLLRKAEESVRERVQLEARILHKLDG